MLRKWCSLLSLRSNRVWWDHDKSCLKVSPQQKFSRIQVGDLGDQVKGNCWLMILSSSKWRRIICFTQRTMSGEALFCINTVVTSYCTTWRIEITACCNNEAYLWPMTVHVTLSVAWNKCITTISVTTESSARKFLPLDLLDPLTCILTTIVSRVPEDHNL